MNWSKRIFSIKNTEEFEKIALDIYHFQNANCSVYSEYIERLKRKEPRTLSEIPFLPISFFKSSKVIVNGLSPSITFKSSGTGGNRSNHFVADSDIYIQSFLTTYSDSFGNPEGQVIMALLPNYIEQGDSSLVFMVDYLIKRTNNPLSGFYLGEPEELLHSYQLATEMGHQVVLFGVSYALLDLAELKPDLSGALIIETGGMKGKRKELTKNELHSKLRVDLNCEQISSEYGMTELLSQSYSKRNGVFESNDLLKILIRDINDPFTYVQKGKTGGINVIDLANVNSCSFIATQDLGRIVEGGFEIMGRFDNSDIRGCNLLVE